MIIPIITVAVNILGKIYKIYLSVLVSSHG
jgi:hypothetical protein